MTDNEAAEIARQLSAGEQEALKSRINVYLFAVTIADQSLKAKGLINIVRIDHRRHENMLTELGNAVLAALQPAPEPAQAGGAVTVVSLLNETSSDLDEALDRIADLETALASAKSRLRQAEDNASSYRAFVEQVAGRIDGNDKDCVFAYLDFKREARELIERQKAKAAALARESEDTK